MELRFRLLGNVEMRVDERLVDIGHAKQRCVLAVLLIEANRTVPADRLLDRVWSIRPPRHARNALSGYLSRLRPILAGAGASIERRNGGYVLGVDPLAVDLHLFHELSAAARTCPDEGDAFDLFDRALGLWHGEAFAGLDTPWVNDVRAGLDAARLAAELDRNDLALALRRHGDLAHRLAAQAVAHPQNERVAGQLMLALYRDGRQSEALQRYELLRRRLAEELGAEPTPELQRLHRRILTGDPGLAWRALVPRQLPAPSRLFVARTRELALLDALAGDAAERPVIVAVCGMAGVGKTALAVHWAHTAARRFPHGQIYVNLRGFDPAGPALPPDQAMLGLLDALGVAPQRIPATLEAQCGLYRTLLAHRRMLVVLDNARDADQILPLLPGTAPSLVIVTSRHRLTGLTTAADAHPILVDLLTTAEARSLLSQQIGERRVATQPQAVDQIIARCARLPLALTIIAARAEAHPAFPLAGLASELAEVGQGRMDALSGGDQASDLRAVFFSSYRALSDAAARMFRLLGLHPGPEVSVTAAASLAGMAPAAARSTLTELIRAHLLIEAAPERYTMHDLLRGYAAEQAEAVDPQANRRAALHRALDHYLHTAHACAMVLHPHRDPIDIGAPSPGVAVDRPHHYDAALPWFTTERPVLLALPTLARGLGLDSHAWRLAWAMWTFMDRQGYWRDMATVGRIAADAAARTGDAIGKALTHRLLARASMQLGAFPRAHAHMRCALRLYRQAGDLVGQAHCHNNVAGIYEGEGRITEALDHAQQALQMYLAANHRRGAAHGRNAVGWYHALLGNHRQAVADCDRALTALRELDDLAGEAMTWDSLGYAHDHLGEHDRAIFCHHQAINGYQRLGDRYGKATTLTRLGDSHQRAGEPDEAREAWRRALAILDELDHPAADEVRDKLSPVACRRSG